MFLIEQVGWFLDDLGRAHYDDWGKGEQVPRWFEVLYRLRSVLLWLHWFAYSHYQCPRCGLPMYSKIASQHLGCMICGYEVVFKQLVESERPAYLWDALRNGGPLSWRQCLGP